MLQNQQDSAVNTRLEQSPSASLLKNISTDDLYECVMTSIGMVYLVSIVFLRLNERPSCSVLTVIGMEMGWPHRLKLS